MEKNIEPPSQTLSKPQHFCGLNDKGGSECFWVYSDDCVLFSISIIFIEEKVTHNLSVEDPTPVTAAAAALYKTKAPNLTVSRDRKGHSSKFSEPMSLLKDASMDFCKMQSAIANTLLELKAILLRRVVAHVGGKVETLDPDDLNI
ncbi:hypothetical protein RRG08_066609 [Elysia crispata]|uniref:Uncharacterized protein n=1 Tax=Elysia crispata TaxID=231223 RepID=A0AAE1D758_9GAST|nr:hypothetical protein RRG08_066609 [Elysia crispata]